jgi:hypothetical protein
MSPINFRRPDHRPDALHTEPNAELRAVIAALRPPAAVQLARRNAQATGEALDLAHARRTVALGAARTASGKSRDADAPTLKAANAEFAAATAARAAARAALRDAIGAWTPTLRKALAAYRIAAASAIVAALAEVDDAIAAIRMSGTYISVRYARPGCVAG